MVKKYYTYVLVAFLVIGITSHACAQKIELASGNDNISKLMKTFAWARDAGLSEQEVMNIIMASVVEAGPPVFGGVPQAILYPRQGGDGTFSENAPIVAAFMVFIGLFAVVAENWDRGMQYLNRCKRKVFAKKT